MTCVQSQEPPKKLEFNRIKNNSVNFAYYETIWTTEKISIFVYPGNIFNESKSPNESFQFTDKPDLKFLDYRPSL